MNKDNYKFICNINIKNNGDWWRYIQEQLNTKKVRYELRKGATDIYKNKLGDSYRRLFIHQDDVPMYKKIDENYNYIIKLLISKGRQNGRK